MTYTNRIVVLVAAGFVVLDMLWFIIRGKMHGFRPAEKITKYDIVKKSITYLLAAAVIGISWFREYGLAGDIAVCGAGVLAFEVTNRYFLTDK